MLKNAYITKIATFLPNQPVSNDEMEEYLGKINDQQSKSKNIVLRNNGIKQRYYAIDKDGNSTHSNLDLIIEAIKKLNGNDFKIGHTELLTCGTASPDQMMPSMSSMVHGELGIHPIDAVTATGSCNSSMWGLNYAYMSILTGKVSNAICTGSEKSSTVLNAKNFEEEVSQLIELGKNPYLAFEKDFLRWMLSDGAAAVLVQDSPAKNKNSLRIDWIEIKSFANEAEACMYMGAVKNNDGSLKSFRDMDPQEWLNQSVFAVKQDSKLLQENITRLGSKFLKELIDKYQLDTSKLDYFLPHISSYYFLGKSKASSEEAGIQIPDRAWFTNLVKIGNVGAAAGFFLLDELLNEFELRKGQTIILSVPESARFSYTYMHLTVV